jgi:hypothetical protein
MAAKKKNGATQSLASPGKKLFSVRQAAELLGWPSPYGERMLCNAIVSGRVPFVEKMGVMWVMPPESIEFLRQFPRVRGMSGQVIADRMRQEALKLDPTCKARQDEWLKEHPLRPAARTVPAAARIEAEDKERLERILKLRDEGWTLEYIAEQEGVSRQRIHAILLNNAPKKPVRRRQRSKVDK